MTNRPKKIDVETSVAVLCEMGCGDDPLVVLSRHTTGTDLGELRVADLIDMSWLNRDQDVRHSPASQVRIRFWRDSGRCRDGTLFDMLVDRLRMFSDLRKLLSPPRDGEKERG